MKFSTRRAVTILLALLAILVVFGCNLFNPSGEGSIGSNEDALLIDAQNRFRDAEYTKSYELFQKVALMNPHRSEAYMGMAKAGMRMKGVNPMTLLQYVNVDTNEVPFMKMTKAEKNVFYQGMRLVDSILSPLADKDTLTMFYEWHLQSKADPAFEATLGDWNRSRLATFRAAYGDDYAGFPLTDRKVVFEKFSVGLTVSRMVGQVLGFLDLNKDGAIDDKDVDLNIYKDENGNLVVDVQNIYDQALTDPQVVDQLNASIDSLNAGMGDLSSLVNSLGGGSFGLDSTSNAMTSEIQGSAAEQINSFQGVVNFYKMADKTDNDGDGCVDEEILDSLDNDGDGRYDEDLRITLLTGPTAYMDGVDNDQDGLVDEADEAPTFEANLETKQRFLGFTAGFVLNDSNEYNSTDLIAKLAVANDTAQASMQYDLARRKSFIGGCWTYYNEARFLNWFATH